MAQGGPSTDTDIHLLECPICLERLQQPKSLPCLHCFCQDCLGTYITTELSGEMVSNSSFPCPICRRNTSPINPEENKDKWANQFPTNAVIQELIQLKEQSSEPQHCTPCQNKGNLTNPAKFWCKKMDVKFCELCKATYHDVLHNQCDISDITAYDTRTAEKQKSVPKCDQHEEKLIWFCEDHELFGCSTCMIKDHRRCDEVKTAIEYSQKLKDDSKLEKMEITLQKGVNAMKSIVRDFDEQIQILVQHQEIALQSIRDLRHSIDKQLDKLQKDVTDKLVDLFKEGKENIEVMSRRCRGMMNSMLNTLDSSVAAWKENDAINTAMLYHKGKTEDASCKSLVKDMMKSSMSVSIEHQTDARLEIPACGVMGNIVIKKGRCFPKDLDLMLLPMSERRVAEITKFNIKTATDNVNCLIRGFVYLPNRTVVLTDNNNRKLKLFADRGQYLDELTIRGNPCDMCQVNNNTVAVAVYSPGGIRVVDVNNSKLSLSSEIDMPYGKHCYGITYTDGKFIISTSRGEIYSVTTQGTAGLLHQYSKTCWSLTSDLVTGDTLVSVCSNTSGDVTVSRLSADKRHTDVLKVGVVREAVGIDMDGEGNIYVCGNHSHNVVQVSGDGAHVRELLTSSVGMKHPCAISFCGNRFVVTFGSTDYDNHVRIFQLY